MALAHPLSSDHINVQPLCNQLATQKTSALFKSKQLELIHLALLAGKTLPPHKDPGEIDVTVQDERNVLRPGEMMYFEGGVPHGVLAIKDASALVTIVLCRP